jgi:hypothetical protein
MMADRTTPEGTVLAGCLRYLQARRIYHWRNSVGAVRVAPDRGVHFGKKGSADIIGCLPDGRFLAVEVKAQNGRLSPEQKQFLAEIRELGGLALVIRDWRELDAALRGAGYAANDMPLFEAVTK